MPAPILNLDQRRPEWNRSQDRRPDGVLKRTTTTVQGLTRGKYDDSSAEFEARREAHRSALAWNVDAADPDKCFVTGSGPGIYPKIYWPSGKPDIAQESVLKWGGTPMQLNHAGGESQGPNDRKSCRRGENHAYLLPNYTVNNGRSSLNADFNHNMNAFKAAEDKVPFSHAFAFRQSWSELLNEPERNRVVSQLETRRLYPVLSAPDAYGRQSAYIGI
jgi:hypothetical protein